MSKRKEQGKLLTNIKSISKYFGRMEREIKHQNLLYAPKIVLTGILIALNAYTRKEEIYQCNNLIY